MLKMLYVAVLMSTLSACVANQSIPVDHYKRMGYPIVITNFYSSPPNYAGGIDVSISLTGISESPIKYVDLDVGLYNRVGDDAYDKVSGKHIKSLRYTGPLFSGKSAGGKWPNVWYNNAGLCAYIDTITVETMTGKMHIYKGGEVGELFLNM